MNIAATLKKVPKPILIGTAGGLLALGYTLLNPAKKKEVAAGTMAAVDAPPVRVATGGGFAGTGMGGGGTGSAGSGGTLINDPTLPTTPVLTVAPTPTTSPSVLDPTPIAESAPYSPPATVDDSHPSDPSTNFQPTPQPGFKFPDLSDRYPYTGPLLEYPAPPPPPIVDPSPMTET